MPTIMKIVIKEKDVVAMLVTMLVTKSSYFGFRRGQNLADGHGYPFHSPGKNEGVLFLGHEVNFDWPYKNQDDFPPIDNHMGDHLWTQSNV